MEYVQQFTFLWFLAPYIKSVCDYRVTDLNLVAMLYALASSNPVRKVCLSQTLNLSLQSYAEHSKELEPEYFIIIEVGKFK